MAQLILVYWRDIPAQIIVKKGRESHKAQLSERFEKAIDRAAMRAGLTNTDSYLEEWRRGDPIEVSDDLKTECEKKLQEIEAIYDDEKLKAMVLNGGKADV